MTKEWIGVDLDGTLAYYDEWRGEEHIGRPIQPMVERVKQWLGEGKTVKIFTARATTKSAIPFIRKWCKKHLGVALEVTSIKDQGMIELWDDRAIQVIKNKGEAVTAAARRLYS
jgi:hypothetical protein